ncbi:MAG TPA: tRNA epoxyqueuosine(34) reductase QueG [Methylomirabilota bacterium]|jgi:epoxyqueuosine reductase|nr:tRNA epoxyqueuosine(34) reductase QueG [Methylomirabilota bacterium]
MSAADLAKLKEEIRRAALTSGFDAARFAAADYGARSAADLAAFLAEGRAGTMDWLAREPERRGDPTMLWPEVRSILVLGANYAPTRDPRAILSEKERGAISVYAQGDDYHELMKTRAKSLARAITERHGVAVKVFVDTAPVMEKPAAMRAGLGWQGKHTNLVSREFGSWLFLAEIFLALELPPDQAEADRCGTCARCIAACPTGAITGPYRIDARACISYLTIEHKGPIPRAYRTAMGNRIYGCDDCLAVCPWNKYAQACAEPAFLPRPELTQPRLAELAMLDDAGFRALFRKSAVKRIGRHRFVRNVAIALGNSRSPEAVQPVLRLLDDASPLVRGAAVWAAGRLMAGDVFAALAAERLPGEVDEEVRGEWRHALSAPAAAA